MRMWLFVFIVVVIVLASFYLRAQEIDIYQKLNKAIENQRIIEARLAEAEALIQQIWIRVSRLSAR